jgi:ubiquinone/menaquinone biosynthesis C-methylase UbiE
MDTKLVRRINRLWIPVYSGIAEQIAESIDHAPRRILEVGAFSGGIALALHRIFPESSITIALEIEELVGSFRSDWAEMIADTAVEKIRVVSTPLVPLNIPDGSQDLVICRGVFFFLDHSPSLVSEFDRVLTRDGAAFIGGGFGSHTPDSLIREIADESRELNMALGKKLVTRDEFEILLSSANLSRGFQIIEQGGLWALIRGE